MHCSICQTELAGPYCYRCGQLHSGKQASLIGLVRESLATFFSLEKSGFATLALLIRNPKRVVHNYWAGNRGYYQSPNKLLFYALLVLGLHLAFVDQYILGLTFNVTGVAPQLLFTILLLPLYSLSGWILYHPFRFSYAKHLIAKTYLIAVWLLVMTVLNDLVQLLTGLKDDYEITFLLFCTLVGYTNWQVFSENKPWWKGLLWSVFDFILLVACIVLIVVIIYLLGGRVSEVSSDIVS